MSTLKTRGGAPADLNMNSAALYREEIFTDRDLGTIRQLTPVKADGSPDPGRPVLYSGQTQLLTPMGTLPIAFDLPAKTLGEAAEKFGAAAKEAIERTMKELQELRREAASQIVIPEAAPGRFGGPGTGGAPGGGRIKLP
jgi:hypothetical protein